IHLIKLWIVGLKSNRPYVCCFGKFVIDDETHMKISDIGLINKIVKTNSFLKRMGEDVNGIYKNYVKVISGITDGKTVLTEDQLKFYSNNLAEALDKILKKIEEGDKDVIKTLAHIRLAGRVKFHSIFGYFSILFRDVFPSINDKKVNNEIDKINKEIEVKSTANN
ncbi:MAG: hypothetical protein NTU76_00095, partial [Candidatus Taylorbacteria bacterium]|nr:hypothetical protein [Candidatus Taylorbacteria bacterium]